MKAKDILQEHIFVIEKVTDTLAADIEFISFKCTEALKNGNKMLFMGNGGSAADSQHLSAEFVGHFQKRRRGLPAIALTTDTSILTSVGNDDGFENIFSRQIEALSNPGDVIFAISTSGTSPNIIKGVEVAKEMGVYSIGLSGKDGGILKDICDYSIIIPSDVTARIQEAHILIGHIICEMVEQQLTSKMQWLEHISGLKVR